MTTTTAPTFETIEVPSHPAANADQQALLDWAAAHPTGRYEPPKPNGRYRLPHPETGEATSWTRATTLASTIDDSEGLTVWRNRLLVAGMTAPGLIDQAAAAHQAQDKGALGSIAGRALHHAGEKLAADIGTALHLATEHADLHSGVYPPEPWTDDVAAYRQALNTAGIDRPAGWVERVVLNSPAGAAGTVDRIVTGPWGPKPRIADLKTGSGADRLSYAVQLAIYAHADHLLSLDGESWEPMPAVDLETALIFHLPAGSGTCEVLEVDIARGWELVQLCLTVREARKSEGLFRTPPPPGPADPARAEWVRGRVRAVAACDNPAAKEALASHWPAGVARKADEWTAVDLHRLHRLLDAVEVLDGVPFPPTDPALVAEAEALAADDGPPSPLDGDVDDPTGPADAATIADLQALAPTLSDEQSRTFAWWERQGRTHGRRWTLGAEPTARIAAINAAALACAIHLDQDATRCAIEAATEWVVQPAWPTGALLGSLSVYEANFVTSYAERVGTNEPNVVADLGDRLAATFSNPNHTNQEQP